MRTDESVAGKVVIVAGASSGMGEATTRLLAEDGAHVVAVGRRGDQLRELTSELRGRGLSVVSCPADLRDREQVERMAATALEAFGRVEALIYTAGINRPERAITALRPEVWDDMIATNLTGAFHCTQVLLPQMLRQGSGLFVYVSSLSIRRPDASGVAYKASKHALTGLADGV
nr:SDR family NAD(P)-dependent oxidoreductase [Dehalococcoidales bacterium]